MWQQHLGNNNKNSALFYFSTVLRTTTKIGIKNKTHAALLGVRLSHCHTFPHSTMLWSALSKTKTIVVQNNKHSKVFHVFVVLYYYYCWFRQRWLWSWLRIYSLMYRYLFWVRTNALCFALYIHMYVYECMNMYLCTYVCTSYNEELTRATILISFVKCGWLWLLFKFVNFVQKIF